MHVKYLAAAGAVLLAAIPLAAHHSFSAEYDARAPVTVTGVVSKIEWSNPHAYIYIDVKDENGKTATWSMEGYPPSTLTRRGFTRQLLSVGDTVTITGFRARDNAPRASAREVTTSDGKKYTFGGPGEFAKQFKP